MNNQKAIDLRFGFKSEEDIHEYLESFFGTLRKTKDIASMGEFYEFDKFNDKYFIEMKTRRIKHNQYESLFFGKNKFIEGNHLLKENSNLRIFYLWRCTDGVFGWEHDSSPYRRMKRGRTDRGKHEIDDCIDILNEFIKPIASLISA